ncbi:hypothetical protein PO909_027586, partial [Leuciscus waleckii]
MISIDRSLFDESPSACLLLFIPSCFACTALDWIIHRRSHHGFFPADLTTDSSPPISPRILHLHSHHGSPVSAP